MDEMKSIVESFATIAKREMAKCKGCGGSGLAMGADIPIPVPCYICAELRKVAEMCWHEWDKPYVNGYSANLTCIHCGIKVYDTRDIDSLNPTPDIPALRKLMETVGVWEKFEQWHAWQVIILKEPKWNEPAGKIWILDYMISNSASMDILTSDKFYTVVEEFLKREAHND